MANLLVNLFRKLIRKINVHIGKDVDPAIKITIPIVKMGGEYGGYWIKKGSLSQESIVYSFGVGEDLSFDLDIANEIGCRIFAFDPTPKSINWVREQLLPEQITFLPWGISNIDGTADFFVPDNPNHVSHSRFQHKGVKAESIKVQFRKLETIMKHFGHNSIDLLKMDIEGEEYQVIQEIVNNNTKINQICLEFHHRFSRDGINNTITAVAELESIGFKLFHREGDCYSFINSQMLKEDLGS